MFKSLAGRSSFQSSMMTTHRNCLLMSTYEVCTTFRLSERGYAFVSTLATPQLKLSNEGLLSSVTMIKTPHNSTLTRRPLLHLHLVL